MDTYTLSSHLCSYDERNPHFDAPSDDWETRELEERKAKPCYCDNCFYGRTELALEIIRLNELLVK